jgi:1,5-anhydro-D-fructose reductase (1,5-anhydro-D-mannitol-forming)
LDSQANLRIGLVGCGWHGQSLAEAIIRSNGLQLTACADPDQEAASRAASRATDVSTHTSVEALLAEREVDAIVIATPHNLLGPVALTALRAGKHVLAEKPIALSDREAAEIESAVTQAGVCYMAGYSMRFSMGRYVRELLDAGVVGNILAVTGSVCTGPLDGDWIAYPETGGGPMLFVGCHLVDLLLWCVGDSPVEVYATVQRRADTGADATSAFQLRFTKSIVAQFLVLQSASTFFYELDIHGSGGKLALRGRNFLQFEIEVSSNIVATYQEPTIIRPAVRRDNVTMMLVPELEEFARAIREHRAPSITIHDGRRVLQVLDAIVQSDRCKQPVSLAST